MFAKKSLDPTPTRTLAQYASQLRYEDLPDPVIEQVKRCVLDNVGCTLFASTLPWSKIMVSLVDHLGEKPEATIWGHPSKTSCANAALVNGTAGHGFELDDFHIAAVYHPGPVSVIPALAIAEHMEGCDGRRFITAIVAACEVGIRIGVAAGPRHFLRGFHPTGHIGAFTAAVAAGKMLELEEDKMVHCLGIAGGQAAGLIAAQEGAMLKRMQCGRAAQSGVYSALLAEKGFTGIDNVLEAEFGGFLRAVSDEPRWEELTAGLGEKYHVLDVGFKPYATGASIHTSLDAVGYLMEQHKITPDMIEKIVCRLTTFTYIHNAWKYKPGGVTAAQMNLYYAVAVRVLKGHAFVDQFAEDKLADPEVLAFIPKIEARPDPELDALGHTHRHAAIAEMYLRDGRHFEERREFTWGSHKRPMTDQELTQKFEVLAGKVFTIDRVEQIRQTIWNLHNLYDVRTLTEQLKS